jgi:hypothetical protein
MRVLEASAAISNASPGAKASHEGSSVVVDDASSVVELSPSEVLDPGPAEVLVSAVVGSAVVLELLLSAELVEPPSLSLPESGPQARSAQGRTTSHSRVIAVG